MKKVRYTDSAGAPHQSMEDEFLRHKSGSEWWYCTGFINDESSKLFSFQFTLARVRIYYVQFHILMTTLMDFQTKKHYYAQQPIFFGKNVTITSEKVGMNDPSRGNHRLVKSHVWFPFAFSLGQIGWECEVKRSIPLHRNRRLTLLLSPFCSLSSVRKSLN